MTKPVLTNGICRDLELASGLTSENMLLCFEAGLMAEWIGERASDSFNELPGEQDAYNAGRLAASTYLASLPV